MKIFLNEENKRLRHYFRKVALVDKSSTGYCQLILDITMQKIETNVWRTKTMFAQKRNFEKFYLPPKGSREAT